MDSVHTGGSGPPEPGGYTVNMLRPDMRDIPQVAFPAGFSIRPMRPGEAALWTDVQRDAEEYLNITDDLFGIEFGDDWNEIGRRCFFVVSEKGAAVGAISAWYSRDFRGQDHGRIHWVAVRPAYQRRGLGKAATSYALNRLAQWHERCYLTTQTRRLAAIRMYLNFGFEPDLDPPGARQAWASVRKVLKHPLLDRCLSTG